MSCTIDSIAEVKNKLTGKWEKVGKEFTDFEYDHDQFVSFKTHTPFGWQNYDMYAFLADVRNGAGLVPLSKPKGFPMDSEWLNEEGFPNGWGPGDPRREEIRCDGSHSHTWLTLRELIEFDYDKTFYDKTAEYEPINSYRECLRERFFEDLEILKKLGDPDDVRVILWFDN